LLFGSVASVKHHNTTNYFLRATNTSVCKKHILAHLKLFKIFFTNFWTTKTGGKMTFPMIPWRLS